jgi:hypothetical protein
MSMSEFQEGALLTALKTVPGAVLGFFLTLVERKRAAREADERRSAAWLLTPMNGYTRILTNSGDAAALSVQLDAEDGDLRDTPESFTLEPGESVPVRVHIPLNNGGNPQLEIRWTSHRGERKAPVRRFLGAPPAT